MLKLTVIIFVFITCSCIFTPTNSLRFSSSIKLGDKLVTSLKMKAVTYNQNSEDTDTITISEVSKPVPLPNTVVVKVHIASINPVDYKVFKGGRSAQSFPFTPGYDFSGVIDSIGDNVDKFKVGDKVFGVNWGLGFPTGDDIPVSAGTFSEYALIHENKLSFMPEGLSFEEAASIPLVGSTAYQSLINELNIQPNSRVLIIGGSGAVGQIGIQIAKNLGAKVYTTCSTRSINFVKQFNSDIIYDYNKIFWENELELQSIDTIFDTIGISGNLLKGINVLKSNGSYLTLTGNDISQNIDLLKNLSLNYVSNYVLKQNSQNQDYLAQLLLKKQLKIIIEEEFPFTIKGVRDIFKKIKSGKSLGKNILRIVN